MNKKTLVSIIAVIILGILGFYALGDNKDNKIGIVTPLSGPSAYYGESTMVGAKMAEDELKKEEINVSFIFEDGKLDPTTALNAAQKLVNADGVSAIYSEFNPASVSISSFLKNKNVFHLYNSAAVSPLENGSNNFKTYLDYQKSCRETAQYIKEKRGIKNVGVLEINLEFGDLCTDGIKEVFGDNVYVLKYDYGNNDFRSDLIKLSNKNVDAVFNVSFKEETLTSLIQMKEFGFDKLFIGLTETITSDVVGQIGNNIQDDVFFGLPSVMDSLRQKIKIYNGNADVADYGAAASAYVNLMLLGKSVNDCNSDTACVINKMSLAQKNENIGFNGFKNRIADFDTRIVEWKGNGFVEVVW